MAPLFYDHLVIKTQIIELINQKQEPENQKGKAIQLVDDIIYEDIIASILEKLDSHKHAAFLSQVQDRPYDPELISYLKEHIGPDIEDNIRREADKVVKNILKDLQ